MDFAECCAKQTPHRPVRPTYPHSTFWEAATSEQSGSEEDLLYRPSIRRILMTTMRLAHCPSGTIDRVEHRVDITIHELKISGPTERQFTDDPGFAVDATVLTNCGPPHRSPVFSSDGPCKHLREQLPFLGSFQIFYPRTSGAQSGLTQHHDGSNYRCRYAEILQATPYTLGQYPNVASTEKPL